ncbi:MAG: Flp pilus assembly protein CpaB [Stellaceae bacterium]
MRARTMILFLVAIVLAGGTAMLVRSWLAQQRTVVAEAAPMPPPALPQKSVLVARSPIARGQKLKEEDLAWHPWPEAGIDQAYVQMGTKPDKAFVGRVAREPFVQGEPIVEAKTVEPGNGGVLAAVLRPGMRAVSVPVNNTSDVSGFIFPGDQVDVVVTETLPVGSGNGVSGQRRAAETALHDVQVVAVDQKLDNKNGEVGIAKNATLEVTPKQSEVLALASEMGKLSLSLRSLVAAPSIASADDSMSGAESSSSTLDSEVSQFLPKPFTQRDNLDADSVTILRGNGKSG